MVWRKGDDIGGFVAYLTSSSGRGRGSARWAAGLRHGGFVALEEATWLDHVSDLSLR